jgi:hypothetical protein
VSPRSPAFFEYYCLKKLGRKPEAEARFKKFRASFAERLREWKPVPVARPGFEGGFEQILHDLADPMSPSALLLRDFYCAEVFLSLDAAEDGSEFFRAAIRTAHSDRERLSSSLTLGQLLLLQQNYPEYTRLMSETVLPLLLKMRPPQERGTSRNQTDSEAALFPAAFLTLLPLYVPEFLASLPDDQVQALRLRWLTLREQAADDRTRLAVDLFLSASAQRLRHDAEQREADQRIEENPARAQLLPREGVAGLIKQVHELPVQLEALQQLVASTP